MTTKMIAFAALALGVLSVANAQVIKSQDCTCNIQVQPNFNVSAYLGTWYEYAKYPTVFESNGKCITAEYSSNADGTVGVLNTQVSAVNGDVSSITGYATVVENAKLRVVFPGAPVLPGSNYWVLGTDYCSYSVVYSCQKLTSSTYSVSAWILTRDRIPSKATVATAESVFVRNQVSLSSLVITDQSSCA